MRVLIVGEGLTDIGCTEWSSKAKEYRDLPGWLQILARRLLPPGDHEIKPYLKNSLSRLPGKARPYPPGHGAKAMSALIKAKVENFDLLIFMTDADCTHRKHWRGKYDEIHVGFARVDGAPIAVACVPKSAAESWLLADAAAWREVGLEDTALLPCTPEDIWGERDDPKADHPHRIFSRVCDGAGMDDGRATYVTIAEAADIDTIARKCPVSFAAFRHDLVSATSA